MIPLAFFWCILIMGVSGISPGGSIIMKHYHVIALVALGAFIALTNTVNTMLVGVLNPILSAVKGSYA
jgi:hypothetical protein